MPSTSFLSVSLHRLSDLTFSDTQCIVRGFCILQDSLAYLATHYGDLLHPLKPNQVLMTKIDKERLEIVYTTDKSSVPIAGKPGSKTVHVPFYPHLAGYSEVRQRLVDVSALSKKVVTTRKVSCPPRKLASSASSLDGHSYCCLLPHATA